MSRIGYGAMLRRVPGKADREETAVTATTPNDVHRLFAERFRAGDLDGLLELYDPAAIFLTRTGETVSGKTAIRELLGGFLQLADTFELEQRDAFEADGVALLQNRWTLTGQDPDGNTIEMSDRTAGIARRQTDGSWKIAVDNPWGLATPDPDAART
jgi:ketosteroid isomerase-like protein